MPSSRSLAAIVLSALAPSLAGQCQNDWLSRSYFPGVRGQVLAAAAWDPDGSGPLAQRLVVGGEFTIAGNQVVQNLAVYDPATGNWLPFGGGANDRVSALVALPSGGLAAGGSFTAIDGQPANRVAIWDGSSWQTTQGGTDDAVTDLCVHPSGDLIAVGRFLTAGGVACNRIARWNGTAWAPLGAGLGALVAAVTTLPNGDIVAGGSFTTAGGQPAQHVARFDGTAWQPFGLGADQVVQSLAVAANGDLIAAGRFATIDGVFAPGIARWDGIGWSAFGFGLTSLFGTAADVTALSIAPNGDVLAGGNFSLAGGLPADRAARWDGVSWTAVGLYLSGTVHDLLEFATGEVFATGAFLVSTNRARAVARLENGEWQPVPPATNDVVRAVRALPGGGLLAGGDFTHIEGVPAQHIARWDGSTWSNIGAGTDGTVTAITVLPDGSPIVGGTFLTAGGTPALRVARATGSTWTPLGGGLNAAPHRLHTLPNGDVLAVGPFTSAGGAPANHLARWDGSTWSEFGGGADGDVRALVEMPNGDLVVGGTFTLIGGIAADGVARWDGSSWAPLGTGTGGAVQALAVLPNGDLVAGSSGSYVTPSGGSFPGPLRYVARWDGTTWNALGGDVDGDVHAIAVLPDGDIVLGGLFGNAGTPPVPVHRIARWDGANWRDLDGGVDPDNPTGGDVLDMTVTAYDGLFVCGAFYRAGNQVATFLARRISDCLTDVAEIPGGCTNGDDLLISRDGAWLGGGATFDLATGPLSALTVMVTGFSPTAVPLTALSPVASPGCSLLASPDYLQAFIPWNGAGSSHLPIPDDPNLIGQTFLQQAISFAIDLTPQILDVTASNLLHVTIGDL